MIDLEAIHTFSSLNEVAIAGSDTCGCFYCLAVFPGGEIEDWFDDGFVDGRKGRTALCPKCGIDAVLPGAEVAITSEMLTAMHKRWF